MAYNDPPRSTYDQGAFDAGTRLSAEIAAKDARILELEAALGLAAAIATNGRDRIDNWLVNDDIDEAFIMERGLPDLADYLRNACKRLALLHPKEAAR